MPHRVRFDSLAQKAYLNLWRTYDRLKAIEEEVFNRYELTPQQYNALRLLRAVHPATLQTLELGTRLVSRAPDMTRLLDKLEERQLIARNRRTDNRRVVDVGITGPGIELLEKMQDEVIDCHHRQLGHLSQEELEEFIRLLHRVREPHEGPASSWPVK